MAPASHPHFKDRTRHGGENDGDWLRCGVAGDEPARLADGDSVERPKPAPDVFLYAAKQLGLEPSHCVVVEDATVGIEAAIAGGMRSILVS